jgi:uncharacterized protein YbaA (DUF1428 family)
MSTETQELIETFEKLPEAKRIEVADFAKFLLAQQGDARWEQILAETKPRPKLTEFLKASKAENSENLDTDRL